MPLFSSRIWLDVTLLFCIILVICEHYYDNGLLWSFVETLPSFGGPLSGELCGHMAGSNMLDLVNAAGASDAIN
ncbi:MAG: hypothetical protein FRX48_05871 [Lasallia pustulata]|uniref:Uncharacterized protein n=1 Tax=Lasallia pustulata TaxID=136370 RepID=A0A5M8PM02_9LECA|nr:MAG: hypothetical protein FRX48_05871 [Lasallia pustulata]